MGSAAAALQGSATPPDMSPLPLPASMAAQRCRLAPLPAGPSLAATGEWVGRRGGGHSHLPRAQLLQPLTHGAGQVGASSAGGSRKPGCVGKAWCWDCTPSRTRPPWVRPGCPQGWPCKPATRGKCRLLGGAWPRLPVRSPIWAAWEGAVPSAPGALQLALGWGREPLKGPLPGAGGALIPSNCSQLCSHHT